MPALHLVTTHLGADLDGLASMVALQRLEGPLTLAVPGGMDPATRRFWDDRGAEIATLTPRPALDRMLCEQRLARLQVVDTSRPDRLGWLGSWADRFEHTQAWDTHPATPDDLDRAVLPDAGSTTAPLVLRLADRDLVPTPAEAGLFLLGIHADTGHFTFPTTTAIDLEAAALCHGWGAPVAWVRHYLPRGLDRHRLALMSQLAERAESVSIAGRVVTLTSLELEGPESDLALLLDELRSAEQWPVAFLTAVEPDRASLIGRADDGFDLRPVLRAFGGGGHAGAGSASLHGWTLAEVRQRLLDALASTARTAGDLATDEVHGVAAIETVREASDALHGLRVNALPVSDATGWVGLVSRRELDDALRRGLGDAPVLSVSAEAPLWVAPQANLEVVRRTLLGGQGRLVLVGEPPAHAQGVITRTTFFRAASDDMPLAHSGRAPKARALWNRARDALGPAADLLEGLGELAGDHTTRAWLVGGTVRDVLLDHTPGDLDVLVGGDAEALAHAAAEHLGGTAEAHPNVGTATWVTATGTRVALARCRAESYASHAGLPRIVPGSLRQDLHRRDFTVNAMALGISRHERGVLQDPFGGRTDLSRRSLRVLHGLSFHDDPTRAIRAARFAARFDLRLAPGTQALLRQALVAGALTALDLQRQGQAWTLLLRERDVTRALSLARDWGVLRHLHKALPGDRELLDRVAATREAWARLAALAPDLGCRPEAPLWLALAWALPLDDRRRLGPLRPRAEDARAAWVAGPGRVRSVRTALRRGSASSEAVQAFAPLDLAELSLLVAVSPPGTRDKVEAWLHEERHGDRTAVPASGL